MRLWCFAHASPTSTKSFKTVFLAALVMRTVALIELPSTRQRITWARRSLLNLFILLFIMLERSGKVGPWACSSAKLGGIKRDGDSSLIQVSKELGLMHMVLNGAHTLISGRIDAMVAGVGGMGIPPEFPKVLTQLTNDWASLFEREQIADDDLYTLLTRTAELSYAMTGNGFYLYLRGAIKLDGSSSEPPQPSSRSRGAAR